MRDKKNGEKITVSVWIFLAIIALWIFGFSPAYIAKPIKYSVAIVVGEHGSTKYMLERRIWWFAPMRYEIISARGRSIKVDWNGKQKYYRSSFFNNIGDLVIDTELLHAENMYIPDEF